MECIAGEEKISDEQNGNLEQPKAVPKGVWPLCSRGMEPLRCNCLERSDRNYLCSTVRSDPFPDLLELPWKMAILPWWSWDPEQILHIGSFRAQALTTAVGAQWKSLTSQIRRLREAPSALKPADSTASDHPHQINSGRMGLKTGNFTTNQQTVIGSRCLFLAIWQHIRYLWCKL